MGCRAESSSSRCCPSTGESTGPFWRHCAPAYSLSLPSPDDCGACNTYAFFLFSPVFFFFTITFICFISSFFFFSPTFLIAGISLSLLHDLPLSLLSGLWSSCILLVIVLLFLAIISVSFFSLSLSFGFFRLFSMLVLSSRVHN